MKPLLTRDIYEITSKTTPIHGVMLRGRIRKLCLQALQNVLVENDSHDNTVRFAVLHNESTEKIENYLQSILSDIHIKKVSENISNPTLSKLKINDEKRYDI